ncbi:MAG: hypothetical protein LJE95_14090 [Acidobacteria bacterium]|nr:hypothetical protein [Acidobacteriota bacterium]
MMSESLSGVELVQLVQRVFQPREGESAMAILTDLPDAEVPDRPQWRARRELAAAWTAELRREREALGLEVELFGYRNVRRNNADLPERAWAATRTQLPESAEDLDTEMGLRLSDVFSAFPILIAVTELSATAPLKLAAKTYGFRAATMPGFSPAMVPALRLDYTEIDRRVRLLKELLDEARGARLVFAAGGETYELTLDLRHRSAHASGGLLPEPGTAGNLPSGEAYIVPYEGEIEGDRTTTAGILPVELEGEVVLYRIEQNRAVAIVTEGPVSRREAEHLATEPAYGNLAELGLGVLSEFGIEPTGEVLLDEKLGLHVAFGRSDHFGGQVGADDFSRPEAVVHQDRVYIRHLQPGVVVTLADLQMEDGSTVRLMRDGAYVLDFSK